MEKELVTATLQDGPAQGLVFVGGGVVTELVGVTEEAHGPDPTRPLFPRRDAGVTVAQLFPALDVTHRGRGLTA